MEISQHYVVVRWIIFYLACCIYNGSESGLKAGKLVLAQSTLIGWEWITYMFSNELTGHISAECLGFSVCVYVCVCVCAGTCSPMPIFVHASATLNVCVHECVSVCAWVIAPKGPAEIWGQLKQGDIRGMQIPYTHQEIKTLCIFKCTHAHTHTCTHTPRDRDTHCSLPYHFNLTAN